jgi:hypothetical protein
MFEYSWILPSTSVSILEISRGPTKHFQKKMGPPTLHPCEGGAGAGALCADFVVLGDLVVTAVVPGSCFSSGKWKSRDSWF